jgi:lipoyl(octanoyl) transferase
LRIERMGRIGYGPMLALQESRHADVCDGRIDDTLFLLEHEPVVTLGRNSGAANLLVSLHLLEARGVELFETGRGGDVTYHGPGQIVGYPIVHLRGPERDIQKFVTVLEEAMIRAANDFDVEAGRVEGMRGVWVGADKLGAVGVRVSRWTTMHGFALNVHDELDGFRLIVPCGLQGKGVTSIEQITGKRLALERVEARLAHHAASLLGRRAVEAPVGSAGAARDRSTAEVRP